MGSVPLTLLQDPSRAPRFPCPHGVGQKLQSWNLATRCPVCAMGAHQHPGAEDYIPAPGLSATCAPHGTRAGTGLVFPELGNHHWVTAGPALLGIEGAGRARGLVGDTCLCGDTQWHRCQNHPALPEVMEGRAEGPAGLVAGWWVTGGPLLGMCHHAAVTLDLLQSGCEDRGAACPLQ